ncbi:MAG TPA: Mov34/MPN/PAD-1 family protein [Anaerolineales bacterium]|nr:Mov34/MPN/PAD-1 family protein [Anaerolineales bacterium]HRQ93164.1 Mov34/MPN/PAD-1 family protein [Anaerolineales bacterium]
MSTNTSDTKPRSSAGTQPTGQPSGLQRPKHAPEPARLPLARAQRWLAAGEDSAQPPLPVFLTQDVFKTINVHAASDMDNEVGGWLAGRWCQDTQADTEFIIVEALLPAQQVRSGSTFLTFTHDSQVAMLSALEEQYEDKCIVGWYHTHPRMGIFLSGYDTWLHDHFFPQAWQIAVVVEPHARHGGVFVRQAGELSPRKYRGFYELHGASAESVVEWGNLKAHPTVAQPPAEDTQPTAPAAAPTPAKAEPHRPQAGEQPSQSQTEADS